MWHDQVAVEFLQPKLVEQQDTETVGTERERARKKLILQTENFDIPIVSHAIIFYSSARSNEI